MQIDSLGVSAEICWPTSRGYFIHHGVRWGCAQVTDLHRHLIDHLTIPSRQGKGVLRRVDEVFDCWFESGSMPYAQLHYPFENKEFFEGNFPADFVAEGRSILQLVFR